jgi:hypothetical protein
MGWSALGPSIQGPPGPPGPPGADPTWGAIAGDLAQQIDLQQALDQKLPASRLTVGPTPPAQPQLHDLWIDTN